MNPLHRLLVCGLVTAITALGAAQVRADDSHDRHNRPNRYVVTNLTSDIQGVAPNTDPVLQNAWGVAFTPGASPFWIADNATGCSTLYDGQGATAGNSTGQAAVPGGSVPATACKHADPNNPPNPAPATPTGLVWNPTTTFLVPNPTGPSVPATFIWDTEDGTISAWAGGLPRLIRRSWLSITRQGAVYKGLVFGTNVHGVFLFATNFGAGTIDVFAPNGLPASGLRHL